MFGFGKKLNEDQKQAMREAQTKSAWTGKLEVAQVGDALAGSSDGRTASVHNHSEYKAGVGHRNQHCDVKPSRFWK